MPRKIYFKKGDWNAYCDICGFEYKASELRLNSDNLYVCKRDWEAKHPQEKIKTQAVSISTSWSRPDDDEGGGLTRYVAEEGGDGLGSGLYIDDTYVGLG